MQEAALEGVNAHDDLWGLGVVAVALLNHELPHAVLINIYVTLLLVQPSEPQRTATHD